MNHSPEKEKETKHQVKATPFQSFIHTICVVTKEDGKNNNSDVSITNSRSRDFHGRISQTSRSSSSTRTRLLHHNASHHWLTRPPIHRLIHQPHLNVSPFNFLPPFPFCHRHSLYYSKLSRNRIPIHKKKRCQR